MPGPIPSNSGASFYSPGGIESEYDKIQSQPELPSVAPPQVEGADSSTVIAFQPSTPIDPSAPDVLDLIKGGRFDPPFTVTLMQREGIREFKSDAGTKREANFKLVKETIRTPADLLRLRAGIASEVYKPLNNMTPDFQFMLYLGYKNRALNVPTPPPAPTTVEVQDEATADAP